MQKFLISCLVVFFCVFSFATPVSAQIMGGVLDTSWNPIQGAFVAVSHVDPESKTRQQLGSSFTDEGGRYDLRRYDDAPLADGKYLVEVQAFGSQIKRIDVEIQYGYLYMEDVFLVQDMPGIGIEVFTFDFEEGSYIFWRATRNGECLSARYVADTVLQGPAETKAFTQFSRRSFGCSYGYVFIPRGAVPEGSTFWGNVTVRSSRSDLRVYAENNWFSFTPGQQSPYVRKGDVPALLTETLQAARAKVASEQK
mgnify:CR=1 FL=1